MLALEMDKDTVKGFMGQLLREELFDEYEVRTVEISAGVRITIDGAAEDGFSSWGSLRPMVYAIIKASPKPKLVKIVFSHKASQVGDIHANAAALFLNLVYENDGVNFTTATAQREFALDKSLEITWDEWVREFFSKIRIVVTDRS